MQNIPQEVSASLEALMTLLTSSSTTSAAADSRVMVTASDSTSFSAPTVCSSGTSSSFSTYAGSSFEIRRAARRLDRALTSLENALLEQHQEQNTITLGPLLQSHLVVILTTLAQALENTYSHHHHHHQQQQSQNQDVLQLYEDIAITACRILVMNDSFLLHQEEQLDALVDRIALLMISSSPNDNVVGGEGLLNALVVCVNTHLLHVQEQMDDEPGNSTILFPLLQGLETISLSKILLVKCSSDLSRRWNPNEDSAARSHLWSLCAHLLKHLATLCNSSGDMKEWLQQCLLQQDEDEEARVRYTTNPQALKRDVNDFLESCRTFGIELLEMGLEILDQANMAISEIAHEAIQHTWLVISTLMVLEDGLEVTLPFAGLQSLFTAFATFCAILNHKVVEQEEADMKMMAFELLVDIANHVLQHASQAIAGNDSTGAAMDTAVSITLLCALDSCGIKEELSPILEYMQHGGQSAGAAANEQMPTAKRQRRDDSGNDSSSGAFTDILQTSIMASLMIPSSDMAQNKDSVARLVQSFPASANDDPWHSLVARKVKETFEMEHATFSTDDDDDGTSDVVSWSDRTLQRYIVDHQAKPLVGGADATQQQQQQANVTHGNNDGS